MRISTIACVVIWFVWGLSGVVPQQAVADWTSPVVYWTFDDPANIGHDASGNGHALTIPFNWTSVEGASLLGIEFDEDGVGTNYGSVPLGPYCPTTGDMGPTPNGFSFAYWAKMEPGTQASVYDYQEHHHKGVRFNLNYFGDQDEAYATVRSDLGDPPVLVATTGTSRIQGWAHLAGVYEPGSPPMSKLYVNGQLKDSAPLSGPMLNLSHYVYVSGSWHGTEHSITDDVRLYDHALSADDVQNLYTVPEPSTVTLFAIAGVGVVGFARRWWRNC